MHILETQLSSEKEYNYNYFVYENSIERSFDQRILL